jgi:hypothetical protein
MMITPPVQDTLYVWKLDARRGVAVLDTPKSKIGKPLSLLRCCQGG